MATVISKDGTRIGYDCIGQGSAVILVDGALGYRADWGYEELAPHLASNFSVVSYDRRGRGESDDQAAGLTGYAAEGEALHQWIEHAIQREVEDLEAVIEAAGGSAYLYGISSGAALVMEAALRLGDKVKKIALYEAPYNNDKESMQAWKQYTQALGKLVSEGRKAEALGLFMTITGATAEDVEGMRQAPIFAMFEASAPTMVYDHTALLGEYAKVPLDRAAHVQQPALVMNGSDSYPFMPTTAQALAKAMPNAQYRVLKGQTHEVAPQALSPVLTEFFGAG